MGKFKCCPYLMYLFVLFISYFTVLHSLCLAYSMFLSQLVCLFAFTVRSISSEWHTIPLYCCAMTLKVLKLVDSFPQNLQSALRCGAAALRRCATRLLVPVSGASESLRGSISGASGELEGGLEGLLARRTRRLRLPSTCGEVSDTSKSRFQPQLQHVAFQRPGSRHTAVSRLICRRTTAACVHRQ